MISSNTIYKISKSYVGEYKLSDTTCVVINLMLYNKKNGTLHTTEIKKRNGYKSEIENLYLISIESDTIALTGEFVENVKYKIQQRANIIYIYLLKLFLMEFSFGVKTLLLSFLESPS
ncbi:hypothetical protein DXC89_10205 [Prevotella disiens]|uniref:Uncharacterized protein n=1 Tax=Prevotella disiens TaxID=28130 RepID=A0A3E4QFE8_9BACT|nr:hypothetical protein DXC89_10205 [Prevotella disiens]